MTPTTRFVGNFHKSRLGDAVHADVVAEFPDALEHPHTPELVRFVLADSDPRLPRVHQLLFRAGFHRGTGKEPDFDPKRYHTVHQRLFDPADLAVAEYLWLRHAEPEALATIEPHPDRTIRINLSDRGPTTPRAFKTWAKAGYDAEAAMPLKYKRLFEAQNFIGLWLRQAAITRRGRNRSTGKSVYKDLDIPPDHPRSMWFIDSTVTLPFTTDYCRKQRYPKAPYPQTPEGPITLHNEGFDDLQLSYRRSDLAAMGAFDVARTCEYRSNQGSPAHRHLVVSQRFYRFCKSLNLDGNWVPVRIEEG